MRPEHFTITRVMIDAGREVCLRLSGDLDGDARDDLRRELYDAVHDNTAPLVVVDLRETLFLDSEAIGALLDGLLRAQEAGKGAQIVNARGAVRTVLQVTGVLDLFGATGESSAGLGGPHGATGESSAGLGGPHGATVLPLPGPADRLRGMSPPRATSDGVA